MCCEGNVHCGVWHWWGNTAPRSTSKADGTGMLPATARSCSTFVQRSEENDDTWWYRTQSFFMTMQGVTPLLLSWASCAADNGRFWNIHRIHPMSPCDYDTFAKVIESLRGTRYNIRNELIHVIGRSIRNINKDGRLPNISQKEINKGKQYFPCIPCTARSWLYVMLELEHVA